MIGVWVLLAALVATAVIAVLKRRVDGRFRSQAPPGQAATASDVVTAAEIGGELGERLTLVQFSSSFCSPCRATRVLLTDVVRGREGVAHVEVDAESNLELVRRLNILRTPTVLVVDPAGAVVGRASGLPRREQVEAVLASAA
ncbi:thioredoxin family protein [Aeromicrobium sp. Leaf350]|uniref:TlpA family protein disulfide reductase n=1 Tax=Aeromicrobium sp. Leaf350 TaxID=2876565 RepID=UPI001E62D2DA|nr:thioredoxin family protein [Aeromicrobium sp. Leaf350]